MSEVGRGWELGTQPECGESCVFTGKAEGDGKMHITLCDFIVPWDTLSTTQKKSLNHRYQMGCECKVSTPTAVASRGQLGCGSLPSWGASCLLDPDCEVDSSAGRLPG